MAAQFRVGDIGSVIRATLTEDNVAIDVSSATLMVLKLKKPSGTVVEKTPVFESTGVDGKIRYVTLAGDLDESGPWTGQVYMEMPTGSWHSEPFNFPVGENLS